VNADKEIPASSRPAEPGRARGLKGSGATFTLVLGGGGARGFAHVGVLRALEFYGLRPSAIVGVSMGAIVGVTYALRPEDWYERLLDMDTSSFPRPLHSGVEVHGTPKERVLRVITYLHAMHDIFLEWGIGTHAVLAGKRLLRSLTGRGRLEGGRVPVAVCATDLRSGSRAVFRTGDAAELAYASSALAGILPPLHHGGALLCDGAYSDIAPVDVARTFGHPRVVAVDPGQPLPLGDIRNGFQALLRALDISQLTHARLRFELADITLRPSFRRPIDVLDFGARRECTAAGIRAVRKELAHLRTILNVVGSPRASAGLPGAN
jgi:NTE family protein